MEQEIEQDSDGIFFTEVSRLTRKRKPIGDIERECLENGENVQRMERKERMERMFREWRERGMFESTEQGEGNSKFSRTIRNFKYMGSGKGN